MTLLEEFIFALSKSERTKLRPLQFRGAKRSIYNKVNDCTSRSGIDSEGIISRYKLTKKRYYQLLSEMLLACYHDIVPGGGTALLFYMGNKQLFRHFYGEMKKQEAVLVENNEQDKLEYYYFDILLKSNLMLLHPKFNEEIIAELDAYAARYIAIKKEPQEDDALYLRIIEIKRHIGEPLLGFSWESMGPVVRELEEMFERVKGGTHILAKFAVNNALMMILSRFHFEGKSPAPYAAFGEKLMKEYPLYFSEVKDFYALECQQFLSTDEGNTIEKFKRYLMNSSTYCGPSLYYIGCFFPKIIRGGEYEWGKEYIDRFFPCNIDLLRSDVANHYWYILTMFYVYAGNYTEGEKCLQKAFAANTGSNRNVNSDIILRCYDVFFAAMNGDPIALEDTAGRQIRYAQRHGYERDQTYQIIFLKAVNDLVKYIGLNTAKDIKIRGQFMKTEGADHLCFLFEKIYEKYFHT